MPVVARGPEAVVVLAASAAADAAPDAVVDAGADARADAGADGATSGAGAAAAALAARLGLPLVRWSDAPRSGMVLEVGDGGLALRYGPGPAVRARTDLLSAPRPGTTDLLFRAVLAGATDVIDATAGLGADAFHLAARGVRVIMIERSSLMVALLADALARAAAGEYGPNGAAASARLSLVHGDARDVLPGLSAGVVLLDPMFPVTGKRAAPRKGMRLVRALEPASPSDEVEHEALLSAARRCATRRVVVKRAARAAPLAAVAPSGSLAGRTVRFDLYASLTTAPSREQR